MNPFDKKFAIITGGSSGIGLALAHQLASLGANLCLIARNPETLNQAVTGLEMHRVHADQEFLTLSADVSNMEQIFPALENLIKVHGVPDYLINSAGITYPGRFEQLPLEIFSQMISVNYLGTVYTLRAVLPAMKSRRSGHVINISSMAGVISIYGYSAYGASKYAVRALSDTIRMEMKPFGVDVSLVFPPDTDTPQLAFENEFKPFVTREIAGTAGAVSADVVAKAIIDGIRKKRYIIIPGTEGKVIFTLNNLLGRLMYPVLDFLVRSAIIKQGRLIKNNRKP